MTINWIWVNYNISQTWIKAIWGWFPLLTMIPSEVAVMEDSLYWWRFHGNIICKWRIFQLSTSSMFPVMVITSQFNVRFDIGYVYIYIYMERTKTCRALVTRKLYTDLGPLVMVVIRKKKTRELYPTRIPTQQCIWHFRGHQEPIPWVARHFNQSSQLGPCTVSFLYGFFKTISFFFPLVNVYITMENHHY